MKMMVTKLNTYGESDEIVTILDVRSHLFSEQWLEIKTGGGEFKIRLDRIEQIQIDNEVAP